MKNSLLIRLLLVMIVTITTNGCSVGRFVTDVSTNSSNTLNVEKCSTRKFAEFFWNENCNNTTVTVQ